MNFKKMLNLSVVALAVTMSSHALAQEPTYGADCELDSVTGNMLCGSALKLAKQYAGPLVEVDFCGKGQMVKVRKSALDTLLKMNEEVSNAGKDCIKLIPVRTVKRGGASFKTSPHFRTNAQSAKAYKRFKLGISGMAAKPGYSMHNTALAFDVRNWRDLEPFAATYGWRVGRYNCIPNDPVHMQPGKSCYSKSNQPMKAEHAKEMIYKAGMFPDKVDPATWKDQPQEGSGAKSKLRKLFKKSKAERKVKAEAQNAPAIARELPEERVEKKDHLSVVWKTAVVLASFMALLLFLAWVRGRKNAANQAPSNPPR